MGCPLGYGAPDEKHPLDTALRKLTPGLWWRGSSALAGDRPHAHCGRRGGEGAAIAPAAARTGPARTGPLTLIARRLRRHPPMLPQTALRQQRRWPRAGCGWQSWGKARAVPR